tara:strand:+ start:375 stop:710 length:336 start_codon:yes stop_codon:yes gene_type:complete
MNNQINKREFIANKIHEITETNKIIKFIEENNINYSSNINGIFVNISILDEKIINELYSLINILLNESDNIQFDNTNSIIKSNNYIIKTKAKKDFKEIKLTPLQVNILELI